MTLTWDGPPWKDLRQYTPQNERLESENAQVGKRNKQLDTDHQSLNFRGYMLAFWGAI